MNINKKVITVLTVSVIAVFALAGCTQTGTKANPAPKPTASSSAAPTKTVVIPDSVETAAGTFNTCNQWVTVTSGVATTSVTYVDGSTCIILPTVTAFKIGDNVIQCEPNSKGITAYGIVFKNGDSAATSTYKCSYDAPVAGQ